MHRRLLVAEMIFLAMAATSASAQSQSPLPTALPGADQVVYPLGLSLSNWVVIAIGGGGGAIVGSGLLNIFKSVVAVVTSYSADYPARLKREADKEGAETLTKQQEAKFTEIVNEALKDREATIQTLQSNMTGLLTNGTQQALLMTQLQQTMLEQHRIHLEEMGSLNGKLKEVDDKLTLRDTQLQEALNAAEAWKKKYEDEVALRQKAEAEVERLSGLVKKATGEITMITVAVTDSPSPDNVDAAPASLTASALPPELHIG